METDRGTGRAGERKARCRKEEGREEEDAHGVGRGLRAISVALGITWSLLNRRHLQAAVPH